MRRVHGLQIQDINGEYSPLKVPYAYAQPKIPATHSDIATPDIVRQWDHLKDVADEIHYTSDVEIGWLEETYQPLSNPWNGEANEPWAKKYKFGWIIIGPVCLDKAKSKECSSVSVNRVTVQRKELPDSCIPNVPRASNPLHQQDSVAVLVNKLRSKDVTSPQIIREIMVLAYSELNYSSKICANEQVESIKDKRFFQIMTAGMHKNQLGNWDAPPPFETDEVNLPDNREQCLRRLLSLKSRKGV